MEADYFKLPVSQFMNLPTLVDSPTKKHQLKTNKTNSSNINNASSDNSKKWKIKAITSKSEPNSPNSRIAEFQE